MTLIFPVHLEFTAFYGLNPEKILAQALASYKEAMDRETLYFFETKSLIGMSYQ
jgi:hypothetical protein